jgi:flagellar motor switch/type III secretory pathway protein FliN
MGKSVILSEEEMSALLSDDAFSEEEFEAFGEELFSPTDFADFCDMVAPQLFSPMSRLAPLIDSTIDLQSPQLVLRSPEFISSFDSPENLIIPVSFLTEGNKRQPDAMIVVSGIFAAKIAVLMIGGDPAASECLIEKSQLSTINEFFRQYRLLLARLLGGNLVSLASSERSPFLLPLIPSGDELGKLSDKIFKGSDHIVELTGTVVLNDMPPASMSFIFPIDVSKELLQRVRKSRERPFSDDYAPSVKEQKEDHFNESSRDSSRELSRDSSRGSSREFVEKSGAVFDGIRRSLGTSALSNEANGESKSDPDDGRGYYSSLKEGRGSHLKSEDSLNVTAILGMSEISGSSLLSLRTGDVVKLDNFAAEDVDLVVNGVVVARGEVCVENNYYAVKIKTIKSLVSLFSDED